MRYFSHRKNFPGISRFLFGLLWDALLDVFRDADLEADVESWFKDSS